MGNRNKIKKQIYFYCFKAIKNYKDAFQLINTIKIQCFNSRLYFYYINNRINLLTIVVNLNKMPFVIIKRQNYIELPKEL